MKKAANIIYIVICLAVCLVPFVGMTVARTDTTTENRRMAKFPDTVSEGQFNVNYLSELGAWFEDHFAFRSQLVMADSMIQSKVFSVSNMDTVLVGKDGWLYYTSTLPDYLGTGTLSEQGIYNAVHNLLLTQKLVEDKGGRFLLTIPPNKNSLYGDHMPYYDSYVVNEISNRCLLEPELEAWGIAYSDLYAAFAEESETLYMKRDSHWNGKGAVLAYNTILDSLQLDHDTYETVPVVREKNAYGDLNKMIYPVAYAPEWEYYYQIGQTVTDDNSAEAADITGEENKGTTENAAVAENNKAGDDLYHKGFSYVTDTLSVEDAWIETVNESGNSSLLMFRDSFGNTLLPLMANAFSHAYFSKSVPYNLGDLMEQYNPEYVVIEKVERNIADFAKEPPIVTGPEIAVDGDIGEGADAEDSNAAVSDTENANESSGTGNITYGDYDVEKAADADENNGEIKIAECEYNTSYWQISGELSDSWKPGNQVYVMLTTSDGEVKGYEAYTVTRDDPVCGYLLYIKKDLLVNGNVNVRILADEQGRITEIGNTSFDPSMPIE